MFDRFGRVSFCPHTKVAGFVSHLEEGRLVASRCIGCSLMSFPPRADCPDCRCGEFDFTELSGRGTVSTFTRIAAAPAGFEASAPYTIGVVDLEETGRLLACFGESINETEVTIGMAVQVVPRRLDAKGETRIDYTLERPVTGRA